MIKKTIEPTGDVCVKFTDEEMQQLGINAGDKFSVKVEKDGILLEKFVTMELDMSEWPREILEKLIIDSCDKDISVNEVISEIINLFIEDKKD